MDAKLYVMIDSMNRDQLRNVMEANAQGTFASWPIDVLRAKVREGYESELLEPETIIECYEATAIIFG